MGLQMTLKVEKLIFDNSVGAGLQIKAEISGEGECRPYRLDEHSHKTVMQAADSPLVSHEVWMQFTPEVWGNLMTELFEEMVYRYNNFEQVRETAFDEGYDAGAEGERNDNN